MELWKTRKTKKKNKKKLNNLKILVWHEFVVHVRERQLIINYISFNSLIVAENYFKVMVYIVVLIALKYQTGLINDDGNFAS